MPVALLGLTVWGIASAAWSSSATQPVLDSQLTLVYAAGAFAAVESNHWARGGAD